MNQQQRQDAIVELVRHQGYASIEQLTEHFTVTPQTIRRDLNALSAEGLIRRVHGGAGLGLALCERIVSAHGGQLDFAHSALGGLQVRLRLPREAA